MAILLNHFSSDNALMGKENLHNCEKISEETLLLIESERKNPRWHSELILAIEGE